MRISIITVVYNNVETLEDTILSVAAQNHRNIEHIVVDGGSNDGTLAIIEKYRDKLASVISEPDKGIYDAMNKGIAISTGEVIGFLNADDIYSTNNSVTMVATTFYDNTEIDACYSDLVYVAENDLDNIVRFWKSCDYKEGLFEKGWCPAHPTLFVKNNVYRKYGDFDLRYDMGNDVEIMMRFIYRRKIVTKYIPKVLVKMRTGGTSNKSIKNILKQNIEIIKAARSNGVNISLFMFLVNKFINKTSQYISIPP